MNEIELAQLFVEYSQCNKKAEELKAKIETAILEVGSTTKIAGVTATYYKPSFETPDYEGAAQAAMPEGFDLSPFTTVNPSTSWKSVCEALGITAPVGKEKPARVVIKVS